MLPHSPLRLSAVRVAPFWTMIASALVGCGEKALQFWLLVTVSVTACNGSAASSARPTMANDRTVGFFIRACSRKGLNGIIRQHIACCLLEAGAATLPPCCRLELDTASG